jgi:integrase
MPRITSKYSSNSLLANPTWNEVIYRIKQYHPKQLKHKIPLIVLSLTGMRVGEFCKLKKKDITYFNRQGEVVDRNTVLGDFSNVHYVSFEVMTLKQRGKKRVRRPVVLVSDFVKPLLLELHEYLRGLEDEGKLWVNSIPHCLWATYKFDKDFYPHLFRHILGTRDGLANMNLFALKKKFGWANMDNASIYVDLNAKDLVNEEERISSNKDKLVVKPSVVENPVLSVDNSVSKGIVEQKKRLVFKF